MDVLVDNYCIDFTRDLNNDGSILAVSNTAGGGHQAATDAAAAQFFEQQNLFISQGKELTGKFKTVDIFGGSFPPLINKLFVYTMTHHWNKAKREGNIEAQERLYNGKILGIAKSILVDWILFIPVFVSTFFRLLFNRKITHIIITQPLGISGIVKAVRSINYLFGRKIHVSILLTDLPTEGTIHYARPLRKLSDKDKANIRVITTTPLILDANESEENWWNRVFGLKYNPQDSSLSQVHYREFPLRPAFLRWRDIPAENRPNTLKVKINNTEEQQFISQLLENCPGFDQITKNGKDLVVIPVSEVNDAVGLITIGSQAAKKTEDYVRDFISVAENLPSDRNYTLFAACGRHEVGKDTLFKKVFEACTKEPLPGNIRVIPMGFQDDDELAPLMHRMDFGIGSTGGLTSFELLRTAKHKVFLHSEAEEGAPLKITEDLDQLNVPDEQKRLLQGFSLWEKWNALYQTHKNGAEIITPGNHFQTALRATLG